METLQSKSGLSGFDIKMIAIITMIIDHIGYMVTHVLPFKGNVITFYTICRVIGRISFPLFCFLLVEGFIHTRNVKQYGIRLFIFAMISEIPFDLAFSRKLNFESQNVFFTLLIGLVVIALIKQFTGNYMAQTMVFAAGCGLSILIKSDYSWMGITIITILYYFRNDMIKKALLGGAMMVISSLTFGYGMAILALIPIYLYNGTKGKDYLKYLFYWFYPVHLLILFAITAYLRDRL